VIVQTRVMRLNLLREEGDGVNTVVNDVHCEQLWRWEEEAAFISLGWTMAFPGLAASISVCPMSRCRRARGSPFLSHSLQTLKTGYRAWTPRR
jgi:hypothetical protein